jgi:hypothetical protein
MDGTGSVSLIPLPPACSLASASRNSQLNISLWSGLNNPLHRKYDSESNLSGDHLIVRFRDTRERILLNHRPNTGQSTEPQRIFRIFWLFRRASPE